MTDRQKKFEFMEELQDRRMLSSYGAVIANHFLEEMKAPLSELINERVQTAVAAALSQQRARKGCDFVTEELKELVGEAFREYFEPIKRDFERIADACRRDNDEADWWKRGADEDEGEDDQGP